ncbi:MAG: hypothetical protein E7295_13890 [Lachnospiraceae bacterium]|nr:hypothetical protein [Lachnospiraceae bacterium]
MKGNDKTYPGGNLTPTKLDVEATKRMIEAGKLMNVPLVDHVVVSSHTGKYYNLYFMIDIIGALASLSIVNQ